MNTRRQLTRNGHYKHIIMSIEMFFSCLEWFFSETTIFWVKQVTLLGNWWTRWHPSMLSVFFSKNALFFNVACGRFVDGNTVVYTLLWKWLISCVISWSCGGGVESERTSYSFLPFEKALVECRFILLAGIIMFTLLLAANVCVRT